MDKENTVPITGGILKQQSHNQSYQHQRLGEGPRSSQIPLKDESNISQNRSTSLKRRVSFAPEVTLHKIDFIQQYRSDSFEGEREEDDVSKKRRETIAIIPSSSDSSQEEARGVDVDGVGVEVLHDSSDEEDDGAPIQSAIPITIDADEELTMEITAPIFSRIVEQRVDDNISAVELLSSDEDEMELTANIGKSVVKEDGKEEVEVEAEVETEETVVHTTREIDSQEDMDVTQSVSKINSSNKDTANNVQNIDHDEDEEEPEMELTQPIGRIDQIKISDLSDLSDTSNVSQSIPTEENEMEITQSVSKITEKIPEPENTFDDSINELFEETTMDITQQVSKIKEPEIQIPIMESNKVAEKEVDAEVDAEEEEEEEEMDFTQQVSNIKPVEDVNVNSIEKDTLKVEIEEEKEDGKEDRTEDEEVDMDITQKVELLSLKRKLDDSENESEIISPVKRKLTPQTSTVTVASVTTTIPLADITNESIDEDSVIYTNMVTISQFMKDIGIRFYDDLEIGSQSQNRISISLPKIGNGEDDFELIDYVMGMIQIPVYELHEFSCKELIRNIKDGIKVFESLNESTSSVNTRLFREFYETVPDVQLSMKTGFQLLKDYSRQEAKKVWYEWRSELIRNLIEKLQTSITKLQEDKKELMQSIEKINEVNSHVSLKHQRIKEKLNTFKKLVQSSTMLKEGELLNVKVEISQIQEHIQQFKREIKEQTKKLTILNEEVSNKRSEINQLQQKIKFSTDIIQRNKKYDTSEINLLTFKFNILQIASKCKFIKMDTRNRIRIEFDSLVEITSNFKDFISFEFLPNKQGDFNLPEFFSGYSSKFLTLIDSDLSVFDQFNTFHKYWINLKKLDWNLYKVSLKFPIRVENTDIIIKYFKPELNCKFELRFSVDLENLSVENFTVVVLRMGELIDTKKILSTFQQDCLNNELMKVIGPVSYNTERAR